MKSSHLRNNTTGPAFVHDRVEGATMTTTLYASSTFPDRCRFANATNRDERSCDIFATEDACAINAT